MTYQEAMQILAVPYQVALKKKLDEDGVEYRTEFPEPKTEHYGYFVLGYLIEGPAAEQTTLNPHYEIYYGAFADTPIAVEHPMPGARIHKPQYLPIMTEPAFRAWKAEYDKYVRYYQAEIELTKVRKEASDVLAQSYNILTKIRELAAKATTQADIKKTLISMQYPSPLVDELTHLFFEESKEGTDAVRHMVHQFIKQLEE